MCVYAVAQSSEEEEEALLRGYTSSPAPSMLSTGLLELDHTASQPLAFALWIETHCFLGEAKC